MRFGEQEWRGGCGSAQKQNERERVGSKGGERENCTGAGEEGTKGVVEEDVVIYRPQRKKAGGHGGGARPQLRRPVLPLHGGISGGVQGISSEVDNGTAEGLHPKDNLADSFNRNLKVTYPVELEEPWKPLWMRENSVDLNPTVAPQERVEVAVGRPIWSPPKRTAGVRGAGRGKAGEGWTPTGDSFLS